ncbi:MAG: LytTR family DNA-binding domain-containing protein [Eubacteriales bacterium]|nr:LytTR family DNA-binding domain-containing protein [Eubacteriales bacterium]
MIYRIGICDDEKSTCCELEEIIIEYFKAYDNNVETFVWNSAEDFMNDVPAKMRVDILFLDIELPGRNGVDVGNYIRGVCGDEGMHIIYISSKTSYAMDLFKVHPYDFLIKPIDKEKVCSEIKMLFRLDDQDKRFFIYEYNKTQHKVLMGNILYFMSERKHVKIVCVDGNQEYVGKLKDEVKKLPDNFAMIGQSYIVNLRHIKECHAECVIMDNGECLGISRNYRTSFNLKLIEYNK